VGALPQYHDLPDIEDWPRMLGCLYVLEGATLGGQIISRHLQRTLHIDAINGAAFQIAKIRRNVWCKAGYS
jgi:heme oxygenase